MFFNEKNGAEGAEFFLGCPHRGPQGATGFGAEKRGPQGLGPQGLGRRPTGCGAGGAQGVSPQGLDKEPHRVHSGSLGIISATEIDDFVCVGRML